MVKILNLREVFLHFRNQIRKLKYNTKIPLNMQYYIFFDFMKKKWNVRYMGCHNKIILYYFTNFVTFMLPTYQPIKFEKISTLFSVPDEKFIIKYEYRKKMVFEWNVRYTNRGLYLCNHLIYSFENPFLFRHWHWQIKIKSAAGNAKNYAKFAKICS